MRIDLVELLALGILVVAVFVAARTWGRVSTLASVALLVLAVVQALWILDVIPPLGQYATSTWAAIACGMLTVLGFWLAQLGMKQPSPLAALVSVVAVLELLVLSGTLRLG
ncbi:MAG TPA: hypothetical protein VFE37_14390 [Chloroflexota bacterium]|nr:hypothetical protein [Chloroflexota bacterium]